MANESEMAELRDELDKLYKNFVVINGRASRLIERTRNSAEASREEDRRFWGAYALWQRAGSHGSSYGEHLAQVIHALDSRWSKAWANHAALLILEPGGNHSPPVLSPSERTDPPSNAF